MEFRGRSQARYRKEMEANEEAHMARRVELPFDPKAFLTKANGGRSLLRYRKDEIIFSQDDPADAIFYVTEGNVKITVLNAQGKEAVVAILGADEFFGEGCLTGQPVRITTALAMTDSTVMRLEKETMMRALHDEPELSGCSLGTSWRGRSALRPILSISCLTQRKTPGAGSPLLANFGEEGEPETSSPKSVRRRSRR